VKGVGGTGADVELRNLTVEVDGKRLLDDVSLTIPAGQTCALVGRTGAGKTSLVETLPRLLAVSPGRVFVGGVDVTTLPLADVRRRIGYAPQDAFLFSATLRENIGFGLHAETPTATQLENEVPAAAEMAGLTPDVHGFAEGLETIVGERGITLSGGQRQRVALARALAADPDVLILDDSLASVDAETERRILDRLRRFRHGRTSVIISHRVAAVRDADQIVVLDQGRIAEQGTHDELLARAGIYSALYQRQLVEAEIQALTATAMTATATSPGPRGQA
jgi:ATP-binding cassette subfamily B protein